MTDRGGRRMPSGCGKGKDPEDGGPAGIREELFLALFRSAAHEYIEHDFMRDAMDGQDPERVSLSEGCERKLTRLIRRAIRREKRGMGRRILLRAAAGALVFLTLSFALAMSVEAVRVKAYNLYINTKEKITSIVREDGGRTDSPAENERPGLPAYVPEGYELVGTNEGVDRISFTYTNQIGNAIIVCLYYHNMAGGVDTESGEYGKIAVGEYEGFYTVKNGYTVLVFNREEDSCSIMGYIDLEEALRIGESIK